MGEGCRKVLRSEAHSYSVKVHLKTGQFREVLAIMSIPV